MDTEVEHISLKGSGTSTSKQENNRLSLQLEIFHREMHFYFKKIAESAQENENLSYFYSLERLDCVPWYHGLGCVSP